MIVLKVSESIQLERASIKPIELRLLKLSVKQGERYLHHVDFTVLTDHRPLLSLLRAVLTYPKMWNGALRYITFLCQFRATMQHIPGKDNQLADIMSRYPFVKNDNTPASQENGQIVSRLDSRLKELLANEHGIRFPTKAVNVSVPTLCLCGEDSLINQDFPRIVALGSSSKRPGAALTSSRLGWRVAF